jgi:hypothetical protein
MNRLPPEVEQTKRKMICAWEQQKHDPCGWNDWGMYTAHVVHGLICEVEELRKKLIQSNIDPGKSRDPFA